MNTSRRNLAFVFTLLLAGFSALSAVVLADDTDSTEPAPDYQPIAEILLTDNIPLVLPAFHDDALSSVELTDLFSALATNPGRETPTPDRRFEVAGGQYRAWKTVSSEDGLFAPGKGEPGNQVSYMAFFITSDRWQKANLKVTTFAEVQVALNGSPAEFSVEETDGEPNAHLGELILPLGKHLVTIKTLGATDREQPWQVGLTLAPGEFSEIGSLMLSTAADHNVDIQKVLNAPRVSGMAVSADGELVALTLGEYRDGENQETWLEVRQTKNGELVQSWRGLGAPARPTWHPATKNGPALCWQATTEEKATIWMFDFQQGSMTAVLEGVESLGQWQWTPDGQSIIYEVNREVEPDERRVKRVLHPADRQPWWRNRSHLMQVFVEGRYTRQLTTGPVSPASWSVSPDGASLAFFLGEPDITQRPFSKSSLWLMDLATLTVEKLLADPWVGGAVFSPDSKTLCLQGSPSAFDGLGRNLPDGVQANDYGGQLYLWDIAEGKPRPITIDLRPDVSGVYWSQADGRIYARCTDTQYHNIYRQKGEGKGWEKMATGLDSVSDFQLAANKKLAVVRGSSVSTPNQVYIVDTRKNRARLLLDPGARQYQDVRFGEIANWVAPLPSGEKLDGFIYYPPGFDPAKTYPLIVYYYGGTSPITRDFGGRYPKNIWAGQGFVVYVPNPSGATGYGQEFAARHVNDWGILTADEVIDGTKAFLASHPFVDAEKIGCIGASYGGFLTEFILTRTDIFAAGVSHAGISSISSYWGEGMWGYGYGARALAHSFPWHNPELFINQSALFQADKINTPLLLVHGDADINVPVGESDQLFTALKILGREVEYVQIVGQDHHILDHEQRIIWNDTILAYFTKYLKGQGQWWDEMYPEPEDYR